MLFESSGGCSVIVRADEKICSNEKEALKREWLETDGSGGYASSTILQCHTRKYHGLFVPELEEPAGRHVLLSKFEDSVFLKGKEYFLTRHRYPGVLFPDDSGCLHEFDLDYCPHFIYRIGDLTLHQRIMFLGRQSRLMIRYACQVKGTSLRLRLKPLLAFRGYHGLMRENLFIHVKTYGAKNGFKIQPYDGMPPLFIQTNRRPEVYPSPIWYRKFEYSIEEDRGYDFHEDLFQPAVMEIKMTGDAEVIVTVSMEEFLGNTKKIWQEERKRREQIEEKETVYLQRFKTGKERKTASILIKTGRQFLVKMPSGRPAIIAGYHWFSDWGRDTLISLPGLTFCSGRPQEGVDILRFYASAERRGLLPNFFSEDGKSAAYNSVDSALWFFWAVHQMLLHTGDIRTVEKDFWPVMKRIISNFIAGTDCGIRMTNDGLLTAGDETTQLTWMDVLIDGKPVTPRYGCAVDVNALWYNALCFSENLSEEFGDMSIAFNDILQRMKESFNYVFWMEDEGCLGDVFTDGQLDRTVRPNQILAVSLPNSLLEREKAKMVVEKVRRELLTPCGLRTLSRRDNRYQGRYEGGPVARDLAYHQGTAWPWMVGQFGEAYLKVSENKREARAFLLEYVIDPIYEHLNDAGLGFISEIFDGDPPHRPNGCIAQAWSSAEVIRLLKILSDID
jgi:predicted glycogen debranching enzyme